jgi:hypothetical protein
VFLTTEEIARLTGYKRKKQQCEQLTAMHVPYRVNARGEPIVSAAYINGNTQPQQPAKTTWQPKLLNFA